MQRGDRGDDRKAQAVTGQAPALVETVEAFDDPRSLRWRNARAIVLNHHRDGVPFLGYPHAYPRPAAGIFQRVIDQIHNRARQQVLIPERDRLTLDLDTEGNSFGLRHGIVEFNDIADDGGERYQREGLAASPGFGFGDLQQLIEHLDQFVDLLDREPCCFGELRRVIIGPERLFESAANAPQRCSQIVGNRVGYVPHAVHQMLDPVEHVADITIEPREFIFHARYRDPPAEITRLYFQSSAADRTD